MRFTDIVAIGSIVVGVILFIAILHSEKRKRKFLQQEIEKLKKSIAQDETKADIEIRIKKLKDLAANVVEEINDNAENKLNTLSNNKIIEFEEYANQVLEKIDINHKEVMFLYDMLNDKVESVKSVVSDLEKARLECVELNLGSKKISKDSSVEDINNVVADNELDEDFIELLNSCSDIEEARGDILDDNMEEISIASVLSEEGAGHYSNNVVEDNNKSKMNDYQKRSEQIIKLYSLGYSTVDISKKLGIGTGEVALINNLYHDRMVVVD